MVCRLAFFSLCSLVCLIALGCGSDGPELGEVKGKVTMDGKPLPNAIVSFTPEAGGRGSSGTTNEDGEYELGYIDQKGALIGKHKVSVTTAVVTKANTEEIRSDDPEYAKIMESRASDYNNATVKEKIPDVYNTNTKLIKEVEKGDNVIDLKLTSDGK